MEKNTILKYDGALTQTIITNNMDIIEKNIENMGMMGKVATITVELSQNMMTYSKTPDLGCEDILSAGFIEVVQNDDIFSINSKNIVSLKDKEKIEPRLLEIKSLDLKGIKQRYKELRKSGTHSHDNNGGIGFFEIAKLASTLNFEFIPINDEKFYFIFDATVEPRKR